MSAFESVVEESAVQTLQELGYAYLPGAERRIAEAERLREELGQPPIVERIRKMREQR